jgi:hypothetical protein
MQSIWSKVLGLGSSPRENTLFLCSFSGFFLVGPVTLKKLVKASVQVFSGRTTKPVWFLKLCVDVLSPFTNDLHSRFSQSQMF